MTDVRLLRSDLGAFADAVGRRLASWQGRSLALEQRTTVIVAPRQSGKSRSLAVLALHRAFRAPGQRVLVVSAGEEAARRLLAEVRAVATSSPLLSGSVVDEQAALLRLSNGSEVRSVPASERQIRGWTVDALLVDEAALVSDDLLLGAAVPTTAARPDARIVLASSALTASGAFYDAAMRGEAGSDHTRTFRWALGDAEWITPSAIEAAREALSEQRFRAEYEGVFASGADALFSRDSLERVTADYGPDRLESMAGPARVAAGVDWGAVHDRSALVAIGRLLSDERRFAVRCAHRWDAGYPLSTVVRDIAGSPALFSAIFAESNGLGLPMVQELAKVMARRAPTLGGAPPPGPVLVDLEDWDRWTARQRRRARVRPLPGQPQPFRTQVQAVHTTADLKAAGYSALRLLIDHERLLLPASAEDLLRELLLLRVELTPTGVERIEASSGHDDLADALVFALGPYRRRSDGKWRMRLSRFADEQTAMPEPRADVAALAGLPTVLTGGGVEVARLPSWVSIGGAEVTLAPDAVTENPEAAYRRRRAEAIRRIRSANRP